MLHRQEGTIAAKKKARNIIAHSHRIKCVIKCNLLLFASNIESNQP